MTEHSFYMERAIQLAKRGTGFTNPNPWWVPSLSKTAASSARDGTPGTATCMRSETP
ncbi:MAG: hypothetical protein ACLUSL_03785 [Ruminococcus sp.]